MNWKARIIRDSIKAMLPFQSYLRMMKRRFYPYVPNKENTELALQNGLMQLRIIINNGISVQGKHVLEIGSGWVPVIPIIFSLSGAKTVRMTDVERLMDKNTFAIAAETITRNIHAVADVIGNDYHILASKLASVQKTDSFESLLREFSIIYEVPYSNMIEDNSIDIILSRAVLEHISPGDLVNIFSSYHRKMSNQGIMCHVIDNSDHFEHDDKSISRVNFLRYSDLMWRLTSINIQNYQNRLRHDDYADIFQQCGYRILEGFGEVDQASLDALKTFSIASRFAGRDPAQLAMITSYFLCQVDKDRAPAHHHAA